MQETLLWGSSYKEKQEKERAIPPLLVYCLGPLHGPGPVVRVRSVAAPVDNNATGREQGASERSRRHHGAQNGNVTAGSYDAQQSSSTVS